MEWKSNFCDISGLFSKQSTGTGLERSNRNIAFALSPMAYIANENLPNMKIYFKKYCLENL